MQSNQSSVLNGHAADADTRAVLHVLIRRVARLYQIGMRQIRGHRGKRGHLHRVNEARELFCVVGSLVPGATFPVLAVFLTMPEADVRAFAVAGLEKARQDQGFCWRLKAQVRLLSATRRLEGDPTV